MNTHIRAGHQPAWLSAFLIAVSLFFAALTATAQSGGTGSISGNVLNRGTRAFLLGAEVRVLGADTVAYTDREGSFQLNNLAAGPVRLEVSYPGLDTQVVTVDLAPGARVSQEIALTSTEYGDLLRLNEFVVAAEREGRAAAIVQQQRAANLKNVISADEFPNVAGGNIGEFLRNVPGIAIDYSDADPRAIRVRGMDTNMTGVTQDGVRVANAGSANANRRYEIEQISLVNSSAVEVVKAPTAAEDADVGGGSINLVSKSAFSTKGRRLEYQAQLNARSDNVTFEKSPLPNETGSYKVRPGGAFVFSDTFLEDKLGVVFTANASNTAVTIPRSEGRWVKRSGGEYTGAGDEDMFMRQFSYSVNPNKTDRRSVSLNLDWRVADHTTVFLYGQVNTSSIRAWGRGLQLDSGTSVGTGANQVNPNFTDEHLTATGNIGGSTTAATSTSNVLARAYSGPLFNKYGAGTAFTFGSKSVWGNWTLNTTASTSLSTTHYQLDRNTDPFGQADFYLRGISYNLYSPGGNPFPMIEQTAGPDIYNLDNYVSRNTTSSTSPLYGRFTASNPSERNGKDKFLTLKTDLRRTMEWQIPVWFQGGAEWRRQNRDLDQLGRKRYAYIGPDGVEGTADDTANYAQLFQDTNYTDNIFGYRTPPLPSLSKITNYFRQNPQAFREDVAWRVQQELSGNRHMEENIYSGYFESNVEWKGLNVLAGVRYEQTNQQGSGPLRDEAAAAAVSDATQKEIARYGRWTSAEEDYGYWFPNVQGRYNITRNLIFRSSFNKTIGRQDFGNLIPGISNVSQNGDGTYTVTASNPGLPPVMFDNYEVSLEYYLRPSGIISVGAFRKDIKNYTRQIDTAIVAGGDYPFDLSPYVGGVYRTLVPVGTAKVQGLEFGYSQELSAFAEFLRGFNYFINYSYLETEGNSTYGGTALMTDTKAPLVNFIPRTFNTGISYSNRRFSASVKYNERSRFPSAQDASVGYVWTPKRGTFDLSLSYAYFRNHRVFLEVKNFTDEPRDQTQYDDSRLYRHDEDGAEINLGLKGSF